MESKLAVVHRSVIVRKGLVALLEPVWENGIVQNSLLEDFMERNFCKTCRLLIFLEHNQRDLLKSPPRNASVVLVSESNGYETENEDNYPCINLNSDILAIETIVNDFADGATKNSLQNEDELTTREKDVLRQVAMGFSNKEIAETLFISIHTVITHRKNITRKLGIKSISGLTVFAIINRIIDPEQIDPEKLI